MTADTRETWLRDLARAMEPIIAERAGVTFPSYRVTCGFPSKGGTLGRKTRVRGQCWSAVASDDDHAEIFVSPVEDDRETIAAILAHEMIHAAMPEAGHKRPFQKAAASIGHVKPFTTSAPTPAFMLWAAPLLADIGEYPHARLNALAEVGAMKKQSARMIKCQCSECGYTARTTRRWLDAVGSPLCPAEHGPMAYEQADDGDAGDDA